MAPSSKNSQKATAQDFLEKANVKILPLQEILEDSSDPAQVKRNLMIEILQTPEANRSQAIREAAQILGVHRTTITRTLRKIELHGFDVALSHTREDKGKYRISNEWQDFIVKTYKRGNRNSLRMSRSQVFNVVKAHAEIDLGLTAKEYPSHVTVYKILEPYLEKSRKSKRHPGQGIHKVAHTTQEDIPVTNSNQIWQADHTKADILLVNDEGNIVGCPFLTIIVDHYSGCVMGYYLGFEAPGAFEVGLALRNAMLPKNFGPEFKLEKPWIEQGIPDYLLTDRAKEFESKHLKLVAGELGIKLRLRAYPEAGGVVESVFGKNNTELLSLLPGYKGSNVQTRPKDAEKNACITLDEFEILLVRYLSQHYNLHQYPKVKYTLRQDRWKVMLLGELPKIDERKLDICLLKRKKRKLQKFETFNFECLTYQVKDLPELHLNFIEVRYDPRDIAKVLVYSCAEESVVSEFLGIAEAQDLGHTRISLKEWRSIKRDLREKEKEIDNTALLNERLNLQQFSREKVTKQTQRRRRRKAQDGLEKKSLKKSAIPELKKKDKPESIESKLPKASASKSSPRTSSHRVNSIQNWEEFVEDSY